MGKAKSDILPRAFPFSWKQLSLWTFGITLQADGVLGKIHEVTPDTSIQNHQRILEVKNFIKTKVADNIISLFSSTMLLNNRKKG